MQRHLLLALIFCGCGGSSARSSTNKQSVREAQAVNDVEEPVTQQGDDASDVRVEVFAKFELEGDLFVDGQTRGHVTKGERRWMQLEIGEHVFEVRVAGEVGSGLTVELEPGDPYELQFLPEESHAGTTSAGVQAEVEAKFEFEGELFVDGQPRGRVNKGERRWLRLEPGEHVFEVRTLGKATSVVAFNAKLGDPLEITFSPDMPDADTKPASDAPDAH